MSQLGEIGHGFAKVGTRARCLTDESMFLRLYQSLMPTYHAETTYTGNPEW